MRSLAEVLGDASADGQRAVPGATALKQNLRSYAALLRAAVTASLSPPFGRDFVGKRLDALARDLGLTCDFDEDSESFLIASAAFYVEITVEPTGRVRAVKVVNGAEDDEEDPDTLSLLRDGDYDAAYAAVGRLQAIHRPHPTLAEDSTERFSRLMAFEKELADVAAAEAGHGAAAVLARGHGMVRSRLGCRVMRIAYHPAAPVADGASAADVADALFAAPATACVDVMVADAPTTPDDAAKAALPPAEKLVSATAAAPSAASGGSSAAPAALSRLEFAPADDAEHALFSLSFVLPRPVLCHAEVARELFRLAHGRDPEPAAAGGGGGAGGRVDFVTAALATVDRPEGGSSFHFYPRDGCAGGVAVERVDVRSVRQVLPALDALRRQHGLNALLLSCATAGRLEGVDAVEVMLVGPGRLALQLPHPASGRLCSVDLCVGGGGAGSGGVACAVTTLPGDAPPCTGDEFAAALAAGATLPEVLLRYWGGGGGAAGANEDAARAAKKAKT